MTTNKTRLQKLESVTLDAEFEYKQFRQEVRADGNTYFINGVQVDAVTYAKEHADYVRLAKDSGIPNEIIIHMATDAGGVQ